MKFKGDVKVGQSLFHGIEQKILKKFVPLVPKFIETYHLTYTTLIWSALILLFSYFARLNLNWLWLVSLCIFLQYITDMFDGAVGRYRNTGLVKWGYYMDHFLDYIFLCSIIIGYSLFIPLDKIYFLFILAVFSAFMVSSFLLFSTTSKFKIAYLKIGPTEIRFIFIILNTLIIFFGKTYLDKIIPWILYISLLGLIILVYKTQKYIWKKDMEEKKSIKK